MRDPKTIAAPEQYVDEALFEPALDRIAKMLCHGQSKKVPVLRVVSSGPAPAWTVPSTGEIFLQRDQPKTKSWEDAWFVGRSKTAHEIGHVLKTKHPQKYVRDGKLVKGISRMAATIANAIEDPRQELRMLQDYPGLRPYYEWCADLMLSAPRSIPMNELALVGRIMPGGVASKSRSWDGKWMTPELKPFEAEFQRVVLNGNSSQVWDLAIRIAAVLEGKGDGSGEDGDGASGEKSKDEDKESGEEGESQGESSETGDQPSDEPSDTPESGEPEGASEDAPEESSGEGESSGEDGKEAEPEGESEDIAPEEPGGYPMPACPTCTEMKDQSEEELHRSIFAIIEQEPGLREQLKADVAAVLDSARQEFFTEEEAELSSQLATKLRNILVAEVEGHDLRDSGTRLVGNRLHAAYTDGRVFQVPDLHQGFRPTVGIIIDNSGSMSQDYGQWHAFKGMHPVDAQARWHMRDVVTAWSRVHVAYSVARIINGALRELGVPSKVMAFNAVYEEVYDFVTVPTEPLDPAGGGSGSNCLGQVAQALEAAEPGSKKLVFLLNDWETDKQTRESVAQAKELGAYVIGLDVRTTREVENVTRRWGKPANWDGQSDEHVIVGSLGDNLLDFVEDAILRFVANE